MREWKGRFLISYATARVSVAQSSSAASVDARGVSSHLALRRSQEYPRRQALPFTRARAGPLAVAPERFRPFSTATAGQKGA